MKHPFTQRYEVLELLNTDALPALTQKRIKIMGIKLKDFASLDVDLQIGLSRIINEELTELEKMFPILSNDFNTLGLLN